MSFRQWVRFLWDEWRSKEEACQWCGLRTMHLKER